MNRLIQSTTTPPGGHRFFHKGTRRWIGPSPDRSALRSAIKEHCHANGVKEPTNEEIDDQMCEYLPAGWCEDMNGKPTHQGKKMGMVMTIQQILSGTKTLLAHMANGRQVVESVEAERRASICSSCIFNQTTGCTGCSFKSVKDLIEGVVGGRTTSYDNQIHGCQICGCHLRAAVWVPLEIIHKHEPASVQEQLPDNCWKKVKA